MGSSACWHRLSWELAKPNGQTPSGNPPPHPCFPLAPSMQVLGSTPCAPTWPASYSRVGIRAPEHPEPTRLISFMVWGGAAPSQQEARGGAGDASLPSLLPRSALWVHMGIGKLRKGKGDWPCPPSLQLSSPPCWPLSTPVPQRQVSCPSLGPHGAWALAFQEG